MKTSLMNNQRPTPKLPAPALLNHWPVVVGLSLLLLIPFFLPIPAVLRRHPLIGHLGDQVHVPFLMILTLLMYWRGPLTGRLKYAAVAAMVLGGSIELVQILVGRAALLADFALDLAGIGLAVGLVIWLGYGRKSGVGLILGIVLILSAQLYFLPGLILGSYRAKESFPLLADFEGIHDQWLWSNTYDALIEFVEIPDTPDGPGTVLRLESGPPSRWPGAQMKHFPHNWSAYRYLKFEARHLTPGREKVPLSIRLDDFQSRLDQTYISKYFRATTQWTTFTMPIAEQKVRNGDRIFNLDDMSYLVIFLSDKEDSTVVQVDNLRLE